ncbi:MAG TPA: mechanosensitive ion channel family protein [Anaerolineales bacterium]
MAFQFLGLSSQQLIDLGISILILLLAILLGRLAVALLLDRGVRWVVGHTKTGLDNALLDTVRLPVYWVVLVIALEIALARLDFLPESWDGPLDNLFFVLYLFIAFVFVWRFVVNFFTWYGQEMAKRTKTDLDEQLMPFFRRVVLIILTAIAFIILLGHFEVDVTSLVATLGIGSLAIALAAQEALADTISGFIIMVDQPFRIGDRIEIQDLNTWGDVVDIGLRSSRIRTRDNRMVIVPNSLIGKSLIVNHSFPNTQYRIQVHIGVAYGTDLEKARRTMVAAVERVQGVLQDRPVDALFLEFGDSALVFRVRWWIDSYVDTRIMYDRVNTAVYKALNEAGIEIPFPQRDVHHKVDVDNARRMSGMLTDNRS